MTTSASQTDSSTDAPPAGHTPAPSPIERPEVQIGAALAGGFVLAKLIGAIRGR